MNKDSGSSRRNQPDQAPVLLVLLLVCGVAITFLVVLGVAAVFLWGVARTERAAVVRQRTPHAEEPAIGEPASIDPGNP